ncbi:MAG: Ku protein, partial [Beijerinckiaceae bacterium]|nr:Ku protein [Beijerinckiaceae bacterium]
MAASVRSFWKGHLRLSLVTIPVRLVTATRSDTAVSFHQVDRKTKQRVRYQKVVPGVGEIDKDDIVRGYEVEPGNYVLLEDEELDALKLETRHTIELTQFVDACEIDPLYFDRPYYVLPDGEIAEEGFRVIRQALLDEGKAGLGQLTLRGKENLVALKPSGPGMLLETMRYAEEIKEAEEVFADIGTGALPADLVKMAKTLIDARTEEFDPEKFQNHYAKALRELVEEKVRTGKSVAVSDDRADREPKVIDFMEALKRSLGANGGGASASPARSTSRRPAARKAPAKPAPEPKRGGKS